MAALTATISWIDASPDDERRIRELVRMFSDAESRDELGIGQIRDIYSDRLFPGTSVIQTRARYYLLIPWLFQLHESRGRSGADLFRRVQTEERKLIEAVKVSNGDIEGLIGSRAGIKLKVLPSTIYWGGLTRYRILRVPVAPDGLRPAHDLTFRDADATDEFVERAAGNWHPTIPAPPAGFPSVVPGGLALTLDEARWLKEALIDAVPGTLLAHLVSVNLPPSSRSAAPWDDPSVASAPKDIKELLGTAERFSHAMHGAALLYNLLLAERYVQRGFDALGDDLDGDYRTLFDDWAAETNRRRDDFATWDLSEWWADVRSFNTAIGLPTQAFVSQWIELLGVKDPSSLAEDPAARRLIESRERSNKGLQARLENDKLLARWNGASGAARLTYRWPTVRRIVTDIVGTIGSE